MMRATDSTESERLALARILITGASSGIGAATAHCLADRGARLVLAGRDVDALEQVASETGASWLAGDLREAGRARRTVVDAAGSLGGLDVVIANAGCGWAGPFQEMGEQDIDDLLDLNLRSVAHLSQVALTYLVPTAGHLVLVGSIAGALGVPGEAWYSATKAALGGLADALRAELRPTGVQVTLVVPGAVRTPYFERRNRPYDRAHPAPIPPSRVADAIVEAIERRRTEVTVPSWLTVPRRVKAHFPGLYRSLAARFG
jgi:short-subunit dehydrogenase